MKKIAILMILVLCAVTLGGCMSSGAGSAVADAVAFLRFDATDDVNLTVDKDNKVLAVTYGVTDSTPIIKDKTVYKNSELVGKTLKEAVTEIVKANGDELTALNVKIISATGKEDAVKTVKEALPKAFDEVFKLNKKGCDVNITYVVLDKNGNITAETGVKEIKATDYIPETDETSSEAE